MSLLLAPERWPDRRRAAAGSGPLAPLADSLAAELEPLLASEIVIPREKAVLSREGGRCGVDGSLLEFDPFKPHEHRCGTCGRVYRGELHDRFWLYWYQLWLAERAVHGALLYRLRGERRHAELARNVLAGYAQRYLDYPNRDNVLGPTRVFFSTYIESIWLLQLCIALDMLEGAAAPGATREHGSLGATVRDRLIEPSASLIALYDEGISNRQTWNNAALMAAGVLLRGPAAAERVVSAPSGLRTHLARALLPDGTWYEGENYHLFAHRALWYCVTMAERLGVEIDPALLARFQEGFATPLLTSLPDLTLVARRDSQYSISLRQVRFAELCELGLARSQDGRLADMLHTLYEPDVPRGDTGRQRSTADVERNLPPTALTRADLGWRSLLHALPELPEPAGKGLSSVLLGGQGIAVLRRERGRVYVALDYGHFGGGHGHPDRLNLLLADGPVRWLDDMGTGSYVERTLFWYRSTLAHNAPLVDGRSQTRVHGRLLAYEDRGAAGWVDATAEIAPGVQARRRVVVMPDYLLDEVQWTAPAEATFDVPFHLDGELRGGSEWRPATFGGGDTPEDGFEFVRDAEVSAIAAGALVCLTTNSGDSHLDGWLHAEGPAECWRMKAPGPPGSGERRFYVVRTRAAGGTLRSLWSWRGEVTGVAFGKDRTEVTLADGTRQVHARRADGWHVDFLTRGSRSSVDLGGRRNEPVPGETAIGFYGDATVREAGPPRRAPSLPAAPLDGRWLFDAPLGEQGNYYTLTLGEEHYRRSEESWHEAGNPSARVALAWTGTELHVEVDVEKADEPFFVPADAVNPYDNEFPDINGDGLQVYLRTAAGSGGWVLVPDRSSGKVRVRPIAAWGTLSAPTAAWRRTSHGYAVHLAARLREERGAEPLRVELDVIVNESAAGRERRRGQLVMSGSAGEFVYLAGDRHDPARLLPFVLQP